MANENNSNPTEMSRDTLLYKICPWDRVNGCRNGTRDYQCYDCVQLMNKWLDEYDKQIRAKAIDDLMEKASECSISDADWHYLGQVAEQLKAGGKN